ncbi:hypothetical protein JQM83_13780 [Parabacteroides distasonis]|nr:hypothetical protein [Parabacteroides distasonis]
MKYKTCVDHNLEGLELILEKAQSFDRESVLQGILDRHYTIYQVEQMITFVQEYHAKLKRECNSLVEFAKTFNHQFATDNNKCFETAERLFWKIRSSVSGTKKIYKKFCKIIRTRFPGIHNAKKPSVFTHSILTRGSFNRDLFGEDSFPKVVTTLCDELEDFFMDLVQITLVCRNVTIQEIEIRKNPKRLEELYTEDYCQMSISNQILIKTLQESKTVLQLDPMTKSKKTRSYQAFLQEAFHQYSRQQFQQHYLVEKLESGHNGGLDDDEALYWPNHHDRVPDIRKVIAHFDELNPKGSKDSKSGRYKIKGEVMARFVNWCRVEVNLKAFIEKYFKKHYQGEFIPLGTTSVIEAKNKLAKKSKDPGEAEFKEQVEALIEKYKNELVKNPDSNTELLIS